MVEDGDWAHAALYVGASLIGGLLTIALGMKLADLI
jgi:fluoride ion exporter CrcB/FEX